VTETHPLTWDDLQPLADERLVEVARAALNSGAAGEMTARSCASLLLSRHSRLVRAVCARSLPREQVDDVCQDAHLRFWITVRYGVRPIENVPALLTVICRRSVATMLESRRRRPSTAPLGEWDAAADDVVEFDDWVVTMLGRLGPRDRAIVTGRALKGHSAAEVGDQLGMAANAVHVAYHRALARLEKELTG
jgi:RNA polymerase sigma factor (sigma-70 family)